MEVKGSRAQVLKESLHRFFSKSGDDDLAVAEFEEYDEHGFMTYNMLRDESLFVIVQCFGDGAYWDARATEIAKSFGLKTIRFATKRSPRGFERKYGYKVIGVVLEREV